MRRLIKYFRELDFAREHTTGRAQSFRSPDLLHLRGLIELQAALRG